MNKLLLGLRRSLIRQRASSLTRQRNINVAIAVAQMHDVPRVNVPVAVCLRNAHKDREGGNKATGMLLEKEGMSFLVSLMFWCLYFKAGSHYATLLAWSSLCRPDWP